HPVYLHQDVIRQEKLLIEPQICAQIIAVAGRLVQHRIQSAGQVVANERSLLRIGESAVPEDMCPEGLHTAAGEKSLQLVLETDLLVRSGKKLRGCSGHLQ